MNLPGFMLVLTGTPDLFPVMDEVFSPIVRQFKKIDIFPFGDPKETLRCIHDPLRSVGMQDLVVFDEVSFYAYDQLPSEALLHALPHELRDIHDLTGGRPYEIQLVCHFMFRRVQEGKAKLMQLSMDVLDDVLRELRQGHDVDARPVITAVRRLDEIDLQLLEVLCRSGGRMPFEQLVFCYTIADGRFTREELQRALERFEEAGIVAVNARGISFSGDDFDRIVCKYSARQRGVALSLDRWEVQAYFARLFRGKGRLFLRPMVTRSADGDASLGMRVAGLWEKIGAAESVEALLKTDPELAIELLEEMIEIAEEAGELVMFVRIAAAHGDLKYEAIRHVTFAEDEYEDAISLARPIEAARERVSTVGGAVDVEMLVRHIGEVDHEWVVQAVESSNSVELKSKCARVYAEAGYSAYVGRMRRDRASRYCLAAWRLHEQLSADRLNNIGYILMKAGELEHAVLAFERAVERASGGEAKSLFKYNLGLAKGLRGDITDAVELIEDVMAELAKNPSKDRGYAVLLVPRRNGERIELEELNGIPNGEHEEPVELKVAAVAKEAMEAFVASKGRVEQ